MIRMSEAVLDGHPDRFCDILADTVIAEAYQVDPEAYGQIEVAIWSDLVWFSGATVTRATFAPDLRAIVDRVGRDIGYVPGNAVDASRYKVVGEPCFIHGDPRKWTHHVNDQCVVHGWAGYDERVRFLPPEHFLVQHLREELVVATRGGVLNGQGPDGKLLVRMREEGSVWILEHVLVTMQHLEATGMTELAAACDAVLASAYEALRSTDARWVRPWEDVSLLVNPNGPLLNGGSDGDNGQTGRKLVVDFYGPRVPIGGGALSGKDLTHIDRAGAYAAREAAVRAVQAGATECLVTLMYAPNRSLPLGVRYVADGPVDPLPAEWFGHEAVRGRYVGGIDVANLGRGRHFVEDAPWNG